MGRLGNERALSVRRCQARRLAELSEIYGRDPRAVLFGRSLGDAPGGRTSVFGVYGGEARDPDGDAGRRRYVENRPSRLFPPRTSRRAVARGGGMARGDAIIDSIFKEPPSLRGAKRRSNPFLLCGRMDCFAEPVIGRAFARPVGSQ